MSARSLLGRLIPAISCGLAPRSKPHGDYILEQARRTKPKASFRKGGGSKTDMFDKDSLDNLFDELRDEYELEPDWEEIQRDAHLGVARLDGGVEIGEIDPRVAELVLRHNPG